MNIALREHQAPVKKQTEYTGSASNCLAVTTAKPGDILKGTIVKISDQISINIDGKETSIPKDAIADAKEGDVVNFQVVNVSENKVELKQLDGSLNEGMKDNRKIVFTKVSSQPVELSDEEDAITSEKEENVKEAKQKIDDIHNQMTEEDYDELSKEGLSLGEFELERFERALERIKTQKVQIGEEIDQKIERTQEIKEEIKEISLDSLQNTALTGVIEKRLEAANLPVTKSNVQAVEKALTMSMQANNLTDASVSYLLQNDSKPTVMNVYLATFSTSDTKNSMIKPEGSFEDVKEQAITYLEQMNKQGIQASLQDAKWLFEHNLPIDKETMVAYQDVTLLRTSGNLSHSLDCIMSAMEDGINPMQANLSMGNRGILFQAMEQMEKVSDDAIKQVIAKEDTISLHNLATVQKKMDENQGSNEQQEHNDLDATTKPMEENTTKRPLESLESELKFITAKRQLEEIRTKLTFEAGLKLLNKGIQIHTQGLEHIVDELKSMETSYYEKLLTEGNVPNTKENLELLQTTCEKVQTISKAPSYVLGATVHRKDSISLQELGAGAFSMTEKAFKANEAYETLMTAPRTDMGDSIKKAFQSVDTILEEMNLKLTKENQRAVRILGYSQMEITEQNIDRMKEYDAKVNQLINQLQPSVTVELIKRNINPLHIPLNELTDQVSNLKEELGISEEERYSNFLAKVQKSETLSQDERDAYVGIYRLLNNVEKTDGKAIGYLVKAERELTLNNLLSAVRTIKGGSFDTTIDDTFGMLSGLTYESKNITSQISDVFAVENEWQQAKVEYNQQLNHQLYQSVTPEFIEDTSRTNEVMEMTLETMYDAYEEYAKQEKNPFMEYEKFIGKDVLQSDCSQPLAFLQDFYLSPTVHRISSAKRLMEKNEWITSMKEAVNTDDFMKTMEEEFLGTKNVPQLKTSYSTYLDKMEGSLKKAYSLQNLDALSASHLNQLVHDQKLLKDLGTKNYYQIPMEVDGETIGVGVSFQAKEKEQSKVEVEVQSDEFGSIRGEFRIEHQEIKGFILYDDKKSSQKIQQVSDSFAQQIRNANLGVKQIHIGFDEQMTKVYQYRNPVRNTEKFDTDGKDLLEVAKGFIKAVRSTS